MVKVIYENMKKGVIISIAGLCTACIVTVIILTSNKLHRVVAVEAGTRTLEVSQFVKNKNTKGKFVTDISIIDMDMPGTYDIKIQIGNRIYSSKLEIKDTVAPTAEAVDLEVWVDEEKEAREFVKNIVDATKVNVSFKEKPDFKKVGLQQVSIILKDTSGNKSELKAYLNIKTDTEAPVISGARDKAFFIGDKIAYKEGITVTDNKDEKVELKVDNSAVYLKKPGSYKVTYTATDAAGNTSTKTVKITIKQKPTNYISIEEINSLADQVLSTIINDNMSDIDKAWAIYKWTRERISYTGTSDKANWMKEATRGIKKGTGDCFTYYSTSKLLLTRAGFKTMCVTRSGGATRHYWLLVYIGDKCYHFDTTDSRRGYYYVCFLRTDAEVAEYSKFCKDYYKFDKSKYPSTPTKPLQFNRKL